MNALELLYPIELGGNPSQDYNVAGYQTDVVG